jgi:hypothetical protein
MNNRYEQVRASLPSESAGGEQRKTPRSNSSSAWRIGKAAGVTAARPQEDSIFLVGGDGEGASRYIEEGMGIRLSTKLARGNRSGFFLGDETGSDFFPSLTTTGN